MLEVKTPEEVLRLIETEFRPLDRRETVPHVRETVRTDADRDRSIRIVTALS